MNPNTQFNNYSESNVSDLKQNGLEVVQVFCPDQKKDQGRKLFLGGIPVDMTDEEVTKSLSQILNVVEFKSEIFEGKTNRGYGYLTVESSEEAQKLIKEDSFKLNGRKIDIKIAETREESMANMQDVMKRKLFVSLLGKDTNE